MTVGVAELSCALACFISVPHVTFCDHCIVVYATSFVVVPCYY